MLALVYPDAGKYSQNCDASQATNRARWPVNHAVTPTLASHVKKCGVILAKSNRHHVYLSTHFWHVFASSRADNT
jgi:hypothetical protein